MTRSIVIADGPARPDERALDAFWADACAAVPGLPAAHQVRSLGIDAQTTELILAFIAEGSKRGTFSLPWVLEANGFPRASAGTPVILTDYGGTPRMLVRITAVRETTFGAIGETETHLDGPPVRDPAVWIPLHRDYWDGLLASYGKRCSDDMPVLVEPFELVFEGS